MRTYRSSDDDASTEGDGANDVTAPERPNHLLLKLLWVRYLINQTCVAIHHAPISKINREQVACVITNKDFTKMQG
jgi:hypothetical protein